MRNWHIFLRLLDITGLSNITIQYIVTQYCMSQYLKIMICIVLRCLSYNMMFVYGRAFKTLKQHTGFLFCAFTARNILS